MMPASRQNGIRVLLVDDDAALRGIARLVLRRAGYDVLEASGGVDALRLLSQEIQPVHLVLSDMVMPEMGGRELAREVHVTYPEIKIVLMSGDSRVRLADDDPFAHFIVFLHKPFDATALLDAIDIALVVRAEKPISDMRAHVE